MILSTDIKKISDTLAIMGCQTIREMVIPYLQQFNISFFNYHKEYFDKTVLILNTDPKWAVHYFEKKYLNKSEYIPSSYKKLNYFLWLYKDYPELLMDAAINFDISNGITIIIPCNDGIEYFGFGASVNEGSIMNFYINNLDRLQRFCLTFKDQAASLLEEAEKNKLILSDKINYLPHLQLSPQLTRCGQLLLEGKTAKEIGVKLGLSNRTIEFYIGNLKQKLDCSNKADLIIKLYSHLKAHLMC